MDEFYELTLPEEKIREMIGTEFDELVLGDGNVKKVISTDIINSVCRLISGGDRPSWMKAVYDEKVHELYKTIRKRH